MPGLSAFAKASAAILLAGSIGAALPLAAQTLEDLDALSDITADEQTGIDAARQQASRGEYLEALSTLERVMAVFPKSREALLIHAIYLCEIDDVRGGLVEIEQMRERDFGAQLLRDARAQCNAPRNNPINSGPNNSGEGDS